MRIPSSANTIAPVGCMSANSGHSTSACAMTAASSVNELRDHVAQGEQRDAEPAADDERPADHAPRGSPGALPVGGAEHPADDHLAGDRDRVEHERQEHEQLVGDLVGARAPPG